MLGSISAFLHKYVAGVIPTQSGWRHVTIAPSFGEFCGHAPLTANEGGVSAVRDTLQSAAGEWRVSWTLDRSTGDAFLNATVPPRVTATIVVPCASTPDVTITEVISGDIVWHNGHATPTTTDTIQVRSGARFGGASFQVSGGRRYSFLRQRG